MKNYIKQKKCSLSDSFKQIRLAKLLMVFAFLVSSPTLFAQVYFHNFGTANISTKPYTATPTTFATNLSSSSWTTSAASFAGFAGNGGTGSGALSLASSTGSPTMTLTFNVASGYQLVVTSYNLWRVRSASGATNYSMTINGITAGSGTIPTTGATLGVTNVTNTVTNLTGTITVIITFTGGTTGTCRLDDFTLNGAVISAGPVPTISTTGSLVGLSTTYGSASTTSTIDVSGADMTAGITATAPTGFEVADNATTGFANSIVVGTAGTIAATPIYIRLKQTSTVAGSPYTGNIVLSSTGASSVNVATVSSTVSALSVSTLGAIASNKIYNGNTTATITGATISTVNGDAVTVNGGGVFVDKNIGTAKSITSSLTLAGTNASSYSLVQPTLTADITPATLTISSPQAQNKVFDNNTNAVVTGTLVGVISPDAVTLNGTGTFASSAVANAIAVTSTSTLSGTDAGNYVLTQPTGLTANITAAGLAPQTITFALATPVTYGVAPIVLGGSASSGLTVSYTSSNPLVASVSNDTLTILSNGTVTITASQAGNGTTHQAATDVTQNLVINQKQLTIINALGINKVYDRTNTATFSGILDGIVGTDVVSSSNTGTFAQFATGTGLTITSTATLTGANAGKYTLAQPTGMSADITPKELTIASAIAKNKIYDGTTTATITGTLSGVVSPDALTLTLGAVFATSAVGNGVSVTSNSIVTGLNAGNYSLTQPLLSANIYPQPTVVENILPQYIQGVNGTNTNRLPYAFRATINDLIPNATYRYYNLADTVNAPLSSTGAGIVLLTASSTFTRVSTPGMSTAGTYGTFTSNASGSYTGWFAMEASGNARFVPGKEMNMRIMLNDGEGGTTLASKVITTNSAKIINLGTTSSTTLGTGLRGNSNAIARNFVFAYDNVNATGRPIAGTYVESDGTAAASNPSFYSTSVDGVAGAYGMIIPNVNTNGIQLLQQLDYATATIVGCAKDADGIWASGANTVNPITGSTAKVLTITDAPLNSCCTATSSTDTISAVGSYTWIANGTTYTTLGTNTYTHTLVNAGGCDSNLTLHLTLTPNVANVNLTAFIQGYYVGPNMVAARYDNLVAAGSSTPGAATDVDSVIVELHDASTYALSYTTTGILQTNGALNVVFPAAAVGTSYYIVLKHQNALQLWSAAPVAITSTTSYNFSTALTQAYTDGSTDPMALLATGIYGMYSGDINQDEYIDGSDYSLYEADVDNSNNLGLFSLPSDLNGDTYVDGSDYPVFDANSSNNLYSQHP